MSSDTRATAASSAGIGSVDGGSDEQPHPLEPTFTISDAIDQLGWGPFQFKLLFLCGMCWCVDAMEAMLLSFLIPKLKSVWHLGGGVDATVGAVVFAGMFVGAFLWGPVADAYGRKRGYVLVALIVGVFGGCSAVSPNLASLLIFRFGVGIGIGGANIPYSLFSEFLPTASRGLGMLVNQMWWTVGAVLECGLAWITLGAAPDPDSDAADTDTDPDTTSWRWLLFFSTLPILALYPFVWWLPESPRYLIVRGRTSEALAILKRISRDNGRPLPAGTLVLTRTTGGPAARALPNAAAAAAASAAPDAVVVDGAQVQTATAATPRSPGVRQYDSSSSAVSLRPTNVPVASAIGTGSGRNSANSSDSESSKPLLPATRDGASDGSATRKPVALPFQALGELLGPKLRQTTLVTWTVWAVSTFGYYGVAFLTPRMFDADPYRMALYSSLFEFPGLVFPVFVINAYGRKRTLIGMLALCGVACGVLAVPGYPAHGAAAWALLFFARMCVAGAFAVVYVYTTELYPSSCRTSGLCTAGAMSRLAGIATTYISTDLSTPVCLLLYAVACFGAIAAVTTLRVETSGTTLADVADDDEPAGH